MSKMDDLIVIGGGAAGIFAALAAKESAPQAIVSVLEKNQALLSKVRISGGGRCNVTHACFDQRLLVQNYPRGHKELLGPFTQFQPKNTIEWFEKHGVALKIESDGRMFPITDSSSTIIECLLGQAEALDVAILTQKKIEQIEKSDSGFIIYLKEGEIRRSKALLLATGSSREGYRWAQQLGHTLQEPIPSLFTFNVPGFVLQHLSGISIECAEVKILNSNFSQKGPLLITHFGLSGPAILKLSAWAARFLYTCGYHADISIRWVCDHSEESAHQIFKQAKHNHPQKLFSSFNPFHLPKNLWRTLLEETANQKLMAISDKRLRILAQKLQKDLYKIEGKTINKEEFVTCGGVTLNEIDFKTMQSKKCPGLFFAGEILDIDGVTGGFNFQNAWTTGYIAGRHTCF